MYVYKFHLLDDPAMCDFLFTFTRRCIFVSFNTLISNDDMIFCEMLISMI